MDEREKIRGLTDKIVADYKAASGYGFEDQADDDPFSLQMDPTPFITMIVTPMVEQIINLVSKKIAERKPKAPSRLTDQEISEIRKIVINYSGRIDPSHRGSLTPNEAARMADSVERVLRKYPRALLGEPPDALTKE